MFPSGFTLFVNVFLSEPCKESQAPNEQAAHAAVVYRGIEQLEANFASPRLRRRGCLLQHYQFVSRWHPASRHSLAELAGVLAAGPIATPWAFGMWIRRRGEERRGAVLFVSGLLI